MSTPSLPDAVLGRAIQALSPYLAYFDDDFPEEALRAVLDVVADPLRAEGWDARQKARPQYLGPEDGHYDDCMGWSDCHCASYPNPFRTETST